ncbi:MAG: SRPBCC family protein, partial [Bacteroidota bacterium]
KWDSKNPEVGYGSLTITASDPNKSIAMMMDFMESGTATGKFKFEKVEGGTNVKWSMETDLGMNLIAKYFGLFMDKMVGPDFEKGLNKLKTVAESTPEIKIEATNIQEQPIISIRTTCNHKDIGQTLGQLYGELLGYMQKSGAQMTGAPLAIYYSYSLEKFDLEAALPVDKVAKPSGKIKSRLMNG